MTVIDENWANGRVSSSPAALLTACLASGARAWRSFRARRRGVARYRALAAVDTRTLKDIGLDRSELLSMSLGDSSGRRRQTRRC